MRWAFRWTNLGREFQNRRQLCLHLAEALSISCSLRMPMSLASWRIAVASKNGQVCPWARGGGRGVRTLAMNTTSSTHANRARAKAAQPHPLLKGLAAVQAGRPRGRLCVAVDIDEVLGSFVSSVRCTCTRLSSRCCLTACWHSSLAAEHLLLARVGPALHAGRLHVLPFRNRVAV